MSALLLIVLYFLLIKQTIWTWNTIVILSKYSLRNVWLIYHFQEPLKYLRHLRNKHLWNSQPVVLLWHTKMKAKSDWSIKHYIKPGHKTIMLFGIKVMSKYKVSSKRERGMIKTFCLRGFEYAGYCSAFHLSFYMSWKPHCVLHMFNYMNEQRVDTSKWGWIK